MIGEKQWQKMNFNIPKAFIKHLLGTRPVPGPEYVMR